MVFLPLEGLDGCCWFAESLHYVSDLVRRSIVLLALKLYIPHKWNTVFLNVGLCKYWMAFRDLRILTEKLSMMLILHLEMLRVIASHYWFVKLLCFAAVM